MNCLLYFVLSFIGTFRIPTGVQIIHLYAVILLHYVVTETLTSVDITSIYKLTTSYLSLI